MKTYDVHFNDDFNNSAKNGFRMTFKAAKSYIKNNNGINKSHFADYKGGIVSIVCNETSAIVYEVEVK